MTKETSRFKLAFKAAKRAIAGQRYGTPDKLFLCPFCGNDVFKLLPSAPFQLSMHPYVCTDCGHVEFFTKMPKPLE